MKQNCWEYEKCGREPGGTNAEEMGVCPAVTEARLDGVHDGKNAGRACWVVSGTLCNGTVQGTYAMKFHNCLACDFYKLVVKEEGSRYTRASEVAARLTAPSTTPAGDQT